MISQTVIPSSEELALNKKEYTKDINKTHDDFSDAISVHYEAKSVVKALKEKKNSDGVKEVLNAAIEACNVAREARDVAEAAYNKCFIVKMLKVTLLEDVFKYFDDYQSARFNNKEILNREIEDYSTTEFEWSNRENIRVIPRFCVRGKREIEMMIDPETCIGSGENYITDFQNLSEKMDVKYGSNNYTIVSKQSVSFYRDKIVEVGPVIKLE